VWVRCLDENLKFRWVFSTSAGDEEEGEERKEEEDKIDLERMAFVRQVNPENEDLTLVLAEEYALESHVSGTTISFSGLV